MKLLIGIGTAFDFLNKFTFEQLLENHQYPPRLSARLVDNGRRQRLRDLTDA